MNGSDRRERLARGAQVLDAAVAPDHPLERGRIVRRAVEQEADQRPEVGERLDLLGGDLDRSAQAGAPVYSSSRRVSSSIAQLPQPAAVHVPELLLVEHRRVLRDPLEPEALGQLLQREVLLVGANPAPSSAM